ncbi:MAG: hypothetical protein ACR652_20490 [Methylocystis sp.]|uniref:hypothetical protein n=1 Tax=Methylocystis sp. TaxID=1911079 RepID=UPI003DA236A6
MLKKLDECDSTARQAPAAIDARTVWPFGMPAPRRVKTRPILIDAAACFIATSLGSLSPQALSLLDLTPTRTISDRVDAGSGKFTDRVLIGGLQPLSWDDPATSRAPALMRAPAPDFADETPAAPAARAVVVKTAGEPAVTATPARSVREAVVKRPDKSPETKTPEIKAAEAVPAPPPAPEVRPAAEPAPAPEAKAQAGESGLLSAFSPASLSTRLAPVGQKVANGAKSLGGVVAGGLSWIGY